MKVAVVEANIVVVVVIKVAVKLLVTKASSRRLKVAVPLVVNGSSYRSCNSIRVAVVKEVVQ